MLEGIEAAAIFQRAQANAKDVACATPAVTLGRTLAKQVGLGVPAQPVPETVTHPMPVFKARFFGFTTGDEESIPTQYLCRHP